MIESKFVDLFAHNSGVRDKLVAEREVVLTYALKVLDEQGVLAALAFKGGTCLRKMVFGSSGRFSEDLDFTLTADTGQDDALTRLVEVLNGTHYGITYKLEDYYLTDEDTSFGGDVTYSHAWNSTGRFRLQVSLRERPTLPVEPVPLLPQSYFKHLPFGQFSVRSLATLEMVAEKVRAAFQRVKVRDLYDLARFAKLPFDGELLRRLVVLKLWQARDPFKPEVLFAKVRDGNYDWDDLGRLMRASETIRPAEIITAVETRFAALSSLSLLEEQVIADAKSGRNDALADRLRAEILERWQTLGQQSQ